MHKSPENGVYIHGLFMEGASWHSDDGVICESRPGQLFWSMPLIWMDPVTLEHAPNVDEGGLYKV